MNDNSVTLLGYYGGDERHCISAWQSTNLELDIELDADIQKRIHQLFAETQKSKLKCSSELLEMLGKAGHHTPFEKSSLDFQLTGEIASHIHALKHRVGVSINSSSARYKESQDQWYIPDDWELPIERTSTYSQYPEAHDFIDNTGSDSWTEALNEYAKVGHGLYHMAIAELTPELGRSRAKESARFFLPYCKQLDFDMMFNFRSFMHFQGLRNSEHAQKEIKEIADLMLNLVREIPGNPFQHSLKAFGY